MSEIGRRIVRHIRETVERRAVTAPAPVTLPETDGQPLAEWEIELGDSLRVDVDLTKDVPCDWDDCEQPAVWRASVPCCDFTTKHCGPHRDEQDRLSAEGSVWCAKCHTPNPTITWHEL